MNEEDVRDPQKRVRAFHRIAEAMKFGYARRSEIADPKFVDMEKVQNILKSIF